MPAGIVNGWNTQEAADVPGYAQTLTEEADSSGLFLSFVVPKEKSIVE
ncbi:MAG: hypothetical protein HY665_00115 [Chloroflexi bacterium]|nr:hypothetical protein [Chloroflexota bacterium]